MDAGCFIISLDCEGKWGMADHIGPHHDRFLTTENLENAYTRIGALFARHHVPATFAFVMAFTLSPAEFARHRERFVDVEIEGGNWLRHFRRQMEDGHAEGWFAPRAFDEVRARPEHEIGCHGFSHLPLGISGVGRREAEHEIGAASTVAAEKGVELRTFVFPRNLIAHTSVLAAAGYTGYRGRLVQSEGVSGKLSELNVAESAQAHGGWSGTLRVIPPGHFLNWRRGVRKLVPRPVTVRRWRHILEDAADRGRVAHLWLHPHNVIDGPETFDTLSSIVAYAAKLRDRGKIAIVTQRQYCEQLAAAA